MTHMSQRSFAPTTLDRAGLKTRQRDRFAGCQTPPCSKNHPAVAGAAVYPHRIFTGWASGGHSFGLKMPMPDLRWFAFGGAALYRAGLWRSVDASGTSPKGIDKSY